jgi:periplasmic protein TonB
VNYLQRSFQISFAVHAVVLLLLILMGDRFIFPEKVLVIDFTFEDSIGAQNPGIGAVVKAQMSKRNAQQEDITKKDAEVAEIHAQSVPQATPPVTLNSGESPRVEIQMPASHSETTATSSTGQQDSTGKGITHESSESVTAGDMNAAPGRVSDNFVDAGRIKYLKANFSYIKDLINRHITYPKTARQMGWQGKVKISFFISSDGHAKAIKIVESSGIGVLDKNAVEAVKSASPFPKPPVEATIIIPVFYQLN